MRDQTCVPHKRQNTYITRNTPAPSDLPQTPLYLTTWPQPHLLSSARPARLLSSRELDKSLIQYKRQNGKLKNWKK